MAKRKNRKKKTPNMMNIIGVVVGLLTIVNLIVEIANKVLDLIN